jgi:hypothetical protein
VIITGRPPSGLTAFAPNGLTARLPIAPRFVAIGPPLPVLVDQCSSTQCSSICGTHAYQIDGTREYHRRQEEGAA